MSVPPDGSWFAHAKDDKLWLDRLRVVADHEAPVAGPEQEAELELREAEQGGGQCLLLAVVCLRCRLVGRQ